MRQLTSYAKVQALIGHLYRNRRFQLRRSRVRTLRYLDVGCGPHFHEAFINLDWTWRPGLDLCWDIRRGLPFPDGRFQGVFSERCLEHFDAKAGLVLLREIHRVLAPGGTLRIVVPDAGLYLRTYQLRQAGDTSATFPFEADQVAAGLWTPLTSVNRLYYQDRESPAGHRQMFDFELLNASLDAAGYVNISRSDFQQGRDPTLLIDTPRRRVESLYVEASVAP